MWEAARSLLDSKELAARASNAVAGFIRLIDGLAEDTNGLDLFEQVEHVIHASGLIEHYSKEKSEKAEARVENLEELVTAARGFDFDSESPSSEEWQNMDKLTAFLTHAAVSYTHLTLPTITE
mgnify:CR=1 FL=1